MKLLETRLKKYNQFQKQFQVNVSTKKSTLENLISYLVKFNYKCIDRTNYTLDTNIILEGEFNRESVYADVVFGRTNSKAQIAIKKIPVDETDLYYLEDFKKINSINHSQINSSDSDILNELFFLNKTTTLLKKKVTNFLPFIYNYYICNDCEFHNKKVLKKYEDEEKIQCLYIITEKADGDLEHYIAKRSTTEKKLYTAYLQIFIALYTIKKFYKIEHQDLHINNILYFDVKPGGYWKYKIRNKVIYVPNYGALFILWDFAFSIIPKLVFTPSNKKLFIKNKKYALEDHSRVIEAIYQANDKFYNLNYTLKRIIDSSKNYTDVVFNLYKKVKKLDVNLQTKNTENLQVIEYYNTDKKI